MKKNKKKKKDILSKNEAEKVILDLLSGTHDQEEPVKPKKKKDKKVKKNKKIKKDKIPNKRLYTATEAAEIKGLTRQGVWQAIQRKQLIAEKVGSTYIILHEDLRAWNPRSAKTKAKNEEKNKKNKKNK